MEQHCFRDLNPEIPLIEPDLIEDTYADGIATVQWLGGNVRTVYFTWACEPGSAILRRVVRKIVRPADSFLAARGGILKVLPVEGLRLH